MRGASSPFVLSVNGVEIGVVQNGTSPSEFNITKASVDGRNIVTIKLLNDIGVSAIEGWSKPSSPSVGEVYVVSQPTQMIRDIDIETTLIGEMLHSKVSLTIKSHALNPRTSTIHYALHDNGDGLLSFGHKDVTLSMRGEEQISFIIKSPKQEGWSAESPQRFTLKLRTQHEGRYLEYHTYKVGFRAIGVDPNSGEMTINGVPTTLTAKSVASDFDPSNIVELKAAGYNTIRIAAGAMSRALYEAADREGLYIISPMPINSGASSNKITVGGNPTNDPAWWESYMQRVDVGYHTTQLHPSVIAFSLADDSCNGYNLYEGYLRLKQKEDPRPVVYFEAGGEWNSDKLVINLK